MTQLLREDPDLAQGLPEAVLQTLDESLRVKVLSLPPGCWQPRPVSPRSLGLLVLDGLLLQRVRAHAALSAEILGCGDVLRPGDEPGGWSQAPATVAWRVLVPTRLAVLDEHATRTIGRHPELLLAVSGRLLCRVGAAGYLNAVSRLRRVEERVLSALWYVADRCGRVGPEGVTIPLRLSHELIGEIVGARRPSVTLAMQQLYGRGTVTRTPEGFYRLIRRPDP